MTRDTSEIVRHAKDYLRGFGSTGNNALQQLAAFKDWQRIAQQELERRACRVIGCFDDDILQAIASGQIDLPALANEVAAAK